jgi:uncharacterized membrane protein
MIVHFPIALAFLIPVFALVLVARPAARGCREWSYLVGMSALFLVTSLAAVQFGEIDQEIVESMVSEASLESHEESGEKLPWFAAAMFIGSLAGWLRNDSKWILRGFALMSVVTLGWTAYVGHQGGQLVYREGAAQAHVKRGHLEENQ